MSDRELAEGHWKYTKGIIILLTTWESPAGQTIHKEMEEEEWMGLCAYLYKEAFVHGMKHGREENE